MVKTITIGNKEVTLDNNLNWMFIYRDQFGHDILPTIMPAVSAIVRIFAGVIEETGKTENLTIKDFASVASSDNMSEALIYISGLEFTELIQIIWALAKNGDDTIPEPRRWLKQFDVFPIDDVVPEVAPLIWKGIVSSKNSERLQTTLNLKPKNSTSTKSSSQELKED